MLREVIRRYVPQFRIASEERRFTDSLRLLDQMKAEFRAAPPEACEVTALLEAIIAGHEIEGSQFAFVAAWYNLSRDYCLPLCRIIESENCREFHESAVELLAEVGDAIAIPALETSLQYHWDFDTWLNIPRKSLQALRTIGTAEALAVIERAATSQEQKIRDEAQFLLGTNGPGQHIPL